MKYISYTLRFLFAACVLLSCFEVHGQSLEDEISKVLDRVEQAHRTDRAFEVKAAIVGLNVAKMDELSGLSIANSKRLRWIVNPVTDKRVTIFADITELYDGNGQIRVTFHHATTVGPDDMATSVNIWNHDSWITSPQLRGKMAERHALDNASYAEILSQKKRNITPYIESRATKGSYLDAVMFVLFVLRNESQADMWMSSPGYVTIESKSYDLDAEIDNDTGELVSFRIGYPWGVRKISYIGRLDGALLPARYPAARQTMIVRGVKRTDRISWPAKSDRADLVYLSARRVRAVSQDQYRWQAVANTLLDNSTGSVLDHDDIVDRQATERMKDLAKRMKNPRLSLTAKNAQGQNVPRAVGWSKTSRGGIAVGSSLLILGGVLFVRRRYAK